MRALPLLVAILLLPVVVGQSHDHGARPEGPAAFALHDGPDDGRAVVGGLTHFGFALLDEKGAPVVHKDARITLTQAGRTLVESASTHEYDGLFSLDVLFTRPGPYEVRVVSDGFAEGVFSGVAVLPANETLARVEADVAPVGDHEFEAVVRIVGPEGLLPHADALLELRRADGKLVSRTHAHIHEEPIAFRQALDPLAGDHTLQVTAFNAFPTGRRPDFEAVVATFDVPNAPGVALAQPVAPEPSGDALEPAGPSASDGGYTLHGMVDPQRLVGLGNPARIAAVVVDEQGAPVPHVDFAFELRGPRGFVFQSASLHEYDGVFEWMWAPDAPGAYEGVLVATRGDAEMRVPVRVDVAPPAAPLNAGPNGVRVEGLEGVGAWTPAEVVFTVENDAGLPVDHSEVDVTVYRDGEPALYQFKMHGHDGVTRATLLFPEEGEWLVRVEPFVLLPQASVMEAATFAVDVGPASAAPASAGPPAADALARVPAPGALALAGLALLAFARPRGAR